MKRIIPTSSTFPAVELTENITGKPEPHLLVVFAQLSPHLSGLLGYLCDGDARVLRLDALAARVEPQHVGAHRPLGAAFVFLLFLLGQDGILKLIE